MPVKLNERNSGRILEVQVTGKRTHDDYRQLVPVFERLVKQHGKIRTLFEMADFHGWEAGAMWDDIKFDLKHFSDIERLAMVGDKKWEQGMAAFCRPFTTLRSDTSTAATSGSAACRGHSIGEGRPTSTESTRKHLRSWCESVAIRLLVLAVPGVGYSVR
jgi:hypothetical protein